MTQNLASTLQQQTSTLSLASADRGVPCSPWLSLPGGGGQAALKSASGRAVENCTPPDQSVEVQDGEMKEDLKTIVEDLLPSDLASFSSD